MIVIASRESRLALWQARHVQDLLQALLQAQLSDEQVEVLGMTTRGDQILDRRLNKIGGKGLFVKELEQALLEGRADLAVHSLKDVPMQLPPEFCLAAVLPRETPLDAFVSPRYAHLDALPPGAKIGTASLRRAAQLALRYPHCQIQPVRGNLDTRLAKLDRGEFDALILAAAGLKRLGLQDRIRAELPAELSLPAAGQGALAIEVLVDNTALKNLLAPLNHPPTAACVHAERAVLRALGGNCDTPIAAYAQPLPEGQLQLRALVADAAGTKILSHEALGQTTAAEALGEQVAQALLAQGAAQLLAYKG